MKHQKIWMFINLTKQERSQHRFIGILKYNCANFFFIQGLTPSDYDHAEDPSAEMMLLTSIAIQLLEMQIFSDDV